MAGNNGRKGPGSTPILMTGDRPLPHNSEAEIAVLGAMLLDPANAIDIAIGRLKEQSCFYNPAHQMIFQCLLDLSAERTRSSVDIVTLADFLGGRKQLDEVGGTAYLLKILNSVPTAANVDVYADIVHQNAVLRRLIHTATDIVQRCYDADDDTAALLDEIESEILSVTNMQAGGEAVAVGDRVMGAINHIESLLKNERSALGIQTGYKDLDTMITGLRPGEMFVLAARPSIGKTAFALNMVSNIAISSTPMPVGIFSLEMNIELLVLRFICSLSRVNLGDIREGALSAARWQEITDAGQSLRKAPVYVDDTGGIDISELRAKARRMKRDHDVQLIVIDYLQLIRASGSNKNTTRENEVSMMSGGIKNLAKELKIPIMVLAQLNRQAEQTGSKPRLSHLRESGAIEQDADVVALLHRERETEAGINVGAEGMDAELIIAKHRNGPTGVVPLTFLPMYTRFESRSRISDSDVPDR